jgi:hypothetical protein
MHEGTLPVAADITEIRLSEVPRGLRVEGEDRADIAYELKVSSTGPEPALALEYAKRTVLQPDALGQSLGLQVRYPEEGRQTASLALRVPRRLKVRTQSVSSGQIANVAAVHLDPAVGDTVVRDVAGAVTGTHQRGSLEVIGAGSVKLALQSTTTRLAGVRAGVTADLRGGSFTITESAGALELDAANAETRVASHRGAIRIGGSGGRVDVEAPEAETRIDMRRAEVEVTLRAPIALTALTTDEVLRLILVGPPPVAIDAVATDGGEIQSGEFGLSAERTDTRQRVIATLGGDARAKIALRNLRSDMVIRSGT